MKNKGLISTILLVIFLVVLITGSSFAFWIWESTQNTNIAFTTQGKNFSCSADGGGNITSSDVLLEPTECTDASHAIVREINTSIHNDSGGKINFNLYLNINSIDTELASTFNFKYVLTDSPNGCTAGNSLSNGSFNGKNAGTQIRIMSLPYDDNLSPDPYSDGPYYLYIWLDEAETDASTAGKSFNMSLIGECSDSNIPNKPRLYEGLIPVKLSDLGDIVTTIAENDPTWYDYDNKKWANAVLVKENATEECVTCHDREYYQSNINITVDQNDILAYYVWIPRYSYEVWQYSGTSSVGNEQPIQIKFDGVDIREEATKNGDWHTHPAFIFGNTELSGIWVGKFETSHATLSSSTANNLGCTVSSCTTYDGLRILPNVSSLRNNSVSNFFYVSRAMENNNNPFGLDPLKIDTHMIKNSEWGAVAYLSHSQYGINEEIRLNNQNGYITGCGALTPNASRIADCDNEYGTKVIYPQSTTGNVTGIFDMSGGASEYVMAFVNVSGMFSTLPETKYFNRLGSLGQCTFATCGGHAMLEMKNWYNDYFEFPGDPLNYIGRGSYRTNGGAGFGIFASERGQGNAGRDKSFRLVLVEE